METLILDWDDGAAGSAVLTLNRPSALNAMNTQMIRELLNLLREQAYNEDPQILNGASAPFETPAMKLSYIHGHPPWMPWDQGPVALSRDLIHHSGDVQKDP